MTLFSVSRHGCLFAPLTGDKKYRFGLLSESVRGFPGKCLLDLPCLRLFSDDGTVQKGDPTLSFSMSGKTSKVTQPFGDNTDTKSRKRKKSHFDNRPGKMVCRLKADVS